MTLRVESRFRFGRLPNETMVGILCNWGLSRMTIRHLYFKRWIRDFRRVPLLNILRGPKNA